MNKDAKIKQLALRIDQELYAEIFERASNKKISISDEIRNLILSGINIESKNDNIFYLIKKVNSYESQIIKIIEMLKNNYDLAVQQFCNLDFESNKEIKKSFAYKDFLSKRRKDVMND